MSKFYLDDTTFVDEGDPWHIKHNVAVRKYRSTYWADISDENKCYYSDGLPDDFEGFLRDWSGDHEEFWRYVKGDLDFRLPFQITRSLHTLCAIDADPSPAWEAECDESMKTFTGSMRDYARQFINAIDDDVGWEKAAYAWSAYGEKYRGRAKTVPWVQEYPHVLDGDPLAFFKEVETVEDYKEKLCEAFRLRILNFDTVKTADRVNPTLSKNWTLKDGAPCSREQIVHLFGNWDKFVRASGFDRGRSFKPSVNVMDWLDHLRWSYDNVPVESEFLGDSRAVYVSWNLIPKDIKAHCRVLRDAGRTDLAEAVEAHFEDNRSRAEQAKAVHALATNPTADNIVKIADYLKHKNT
jgi:hypothetical protein